MEEKFIPNNGRRKFIGDVAAVMGTAALAGISLDGLAAARPASWTVGEIMDKFIAEVPGAPFAKTVDTLKAGDRSNKVTSIVTSMFPSIDVIRKTIDKGANFIICHEPSYYSHEDKTEWLQNDPVYKYKRDLLDKHGISIWRNHDYFHSHKPDGVFDVLVEQLGWTAAFNKTDLMVTYAKPMSLQDMIKHIKTKLNIPMVRYVGKKDMTCKNALLIPGAAGGTTQINLARARKPDVIICGEISEWETAEYVRDANSKGDALGLIVLGHIPSEEGGSLYMKQWIEQNIAGLGVTHFPTGPSLNFL